MGFEMYQDKQSTEFSTIDCLHFNQCSGCEIQKEVILPPIWQEIKAEFHLLEPRLNLSLFHAEILGWRTRAKLAVRGSKKEPQIGLFKRGTHDVVDIPDCPLHHPLINQALQVLKETMIQHAMQPYDEKKKTGVLRYLQLTIERKTRKVQLVLVANLNNSDPSLKEFVKQLYIHPLWHSIWINYNQAANNVIFSSNWSLQQGEEYLWEELAHTSLCFHPACFSQVHLSLFEKMLFSIKHSISKDKNVVEFYAGVGAIGLSVASLCKTLLCLEVNPFAKACFKASFERLPPHIQKRVSFEQGTSEAFCQKAQEAEVLIVDPPRKGLDAALLQAITSSCTLEQLIYVSCGWLSFKRDVEVLKKAGWQIEKTEGYLLFPGTNHIEILAFLKKL